MIGDKLSEFGLDLWDLLGFDIVNLQELDFGLHQ